MKFAPCKFFDSNILMASQTKPNIKRGSAKKKIMMKKTHSISCVEYELFPVIWKQNNDYDNIVCFRWHYFFLQFFVFFFMLSNLSNWFFFFCFARRFGSARVARWATTDINYHQQIAFIVTLTTSCTDRRYRLRSACAFHLNQK